MTLRLRVMGSPRVGGADVGRRLALAVPLVLGMACGGDSGGGQNVLPTASATGSGSASGSSGAGTTASSAGSTTSAATGAATGAMQTFPVTYRFDCINIRQLGGEPMDALPLQASVLQNAWGDDMRNYKLNIMLEVDSRTDGGGAAQVGIRSGIGTGASDQCAEPTSESDLIDITWDPSVTTWSAGGKDVCSAPATAGATSGGTYTMMLGPSDLIYIYSQDDDGTTFNCTPDSSPDAVPIRAVQATVTSNVAGDKIFGELTGCLKASEAHGLCSCLVKCSGTPDPACAGCPDGSTTLDNLLGNVATSSTCTGLLGADAYDLKIGFTGSALPDVPMTCGG